MKYIPDHGMIIDFEDIKKHYVNKRRSEFVDALKNSSTIIKEIKDIENSAEFKAVDNIDTNDLFSIDTKEINVLADKLTQFNNLVKAINLGSSNVIDIEYSLAFNKLEKYRVKSTLLNDAHMASVVATHSMKYCRFKKSEDFKAPEEDIFTNDGTDYVAKSEYIEKIQNLDASSFYNESDVVTKRKVEQILDSINKSDATVADRETVSIDFDMLMELLLIAERGKYATVRKVVHNEERIEHVLSDESHKKLKRLVAQSYYKLKTREETSSNNKKGDDFNAIFNSESVAGKGFGKAGNQKEND